MYRLSVYLFACVFLLASPVLAQGIALEFGSASVQNIGFQQSAGFSIRVPITKYVSGNFTYSRWRGIDKGLAEDIDDPVYSSDSRFYGNNALNLILMGEVIRFGKPSLLIGAGMGLYEFIELDMFNNRNSIFRSYLSAATELRFPLSEQSTFFLKAVAGFRENGVTARWGIFTAGVGFQLY